VFLGEDNSVKLGDFGLSKVMQSHDFASTYVGTPFYMSPEICAAEKYTLKSDIWSLGCIIYELCTREPPFNAKTHFQLVQKIKEGKIAPLPAIYSAELFAVIKDCLRVNPDRRPDTAMLLNLPVVRLMRKEKEVVEFSKTLKAKEESLNRRIRELDQKLTALDQDRASMRQELDASLRREWEVKARLEIDRLVALEIEQLQRKFESEVQLRVDMELQNRKDDEGRQDLSSSISKSEYPHSSFGSTEGELSSATDLSELSVDSPDTSMHPLKKSARTPFARAQTMFAMAPAGTPMDIEMASPSPITIASLSLSPRRNAGTKPPVLNPGNIFAADQAARDARWEPAQDSESEFEDDIQVPSPTRMIKSSKNPFTAKGRPQLHAQKSMPVHRLQSKQSQALQGKTIPVAASTPDLQTAVRTTGGNGALQDRSNSPSRRLSKIPSAANLKTNSGGSDGLSATLNRKPSMGKKDGSNDLHQQSQASAAVQPPVLNKLPGPGKNNIRGRTLVELQQARAGGRPMSAVFTSEVNHSHNLIINTNVSPVRAFREHAAAANRGTVLSEPAAVWDPERDEMPSPFLVRRKPVKVERGSA
jgi:NIMA (never in mitosis gene a)-related kinase